MKKIIVAILVIAVLGAAGFGAYYFLFSGADKPAPVTKDGLVTEENAKYFYKNGEKVKDSWVENDGSYYYFGENGAAVTNVQLIDGESYVFASDGRLMTGQISLNGRDSFFLSGRRITSEWVTVGEKEYYISAESKILTSETGTIEAEGTVCNVFPDGAHKEGVVTENGKNYWYEDGWAGYKTGFVSNGKYYAGEDGVLVTGIALIDGKFILFREDGLFEKFYKSEYVIYEGKTYYVKSSSIAAKSEWLTIGGEKYYFNAEGQKLSGVTTVGGAYYEFSADGAMKKQFKNEFLTVSGSRIYVGADGKPYQNRWIEISPDFYRTSDGGKVLTGYQTVDLIKFTFASDGKLVQDERKIYTLGKDGKMTVTAKKNGLVEIEGKTYLYSLDSLLTGWQTADGVKYYFDPEDAGAMAKEKTLEISGKNYYFDEDGLTLSGVCGLSDVYYEFADEGYVIRMLSEEFLTVQNGRIYVLSTGKAAKSRFIKSGDDYYYAGSDGMIAVSSVTVGENTFAVGDGGKITLDPVKRYVYDADAGTLTPMDKLNGFVTEGGVTRYYINDEFVTGISSVSGKTYCFDTSTGAMAKNTFKTVSSKTYYFGSDGAALTGTQKISDSFYDFDSSGVQTKKYASEKVSWNGAFYYAKSTGTIAKNEWVTSGAFKYRAASDGKLLSGWQTVDGNKYYFKPATAAMAKSETVTIDGKTYKFNSEGLLSLTDDDIGEDDEFTKRY